MSRLTFILLMVAAVIMGLTATSILAGHVMTVADFDASAGELPEALAVDRKGNIYVSMSISPTGEIKKVTPEGEVSTFANLPSPGAGFLLGLAFDRKGNLYVAMSSFDPTTHGVWRVSRDGSEVEQFASLLNDAGEADGLPNGMIFDGKGNLYVSDSIGGKVWRIDRWGNVSVWKADPLLLGVIPPAVLPFPVGADGIAFDEDNENLYVANLDFGRIVRIPLEEDGSAGNAEVFVDNPLLVGVDGITFDDDENLYGAVNSQDRLVVISENGDVTILAEGDPPLQNPSDVRFGRKKDEDTLYITNFAIFRALGITPGDPRPALVKMSIEDEDDDDDNSDDDD